MDLNELKKHPRLVELRFALLYDDLIRSFGVEATTGLLSSIASAFLINNSIISALITKRIDIIAMRRTNKERFRQEVILLGKTLGYTDTDIATKLLKVSRQTYYSHGKHVYDIDEFLTNEWISELDYNTTVLGVTAYYNEIYRLLSILDTLKSVI